MPGIWGFPVTHSFSDPVKVLKNRGKGQTWLRERERAGATKASEQDSVLSFRGQWDVIIKAGNGGTGVPEASM